MKKTPLILSALSMVGIGSVLASPVRGSEGVPAPLALMSPISMKEVTDTNSIGMLTAQATAYPDINLAEANVNNGLVEISSLRPNDLGINVEQLTLREDWRIQRIVLYYRDFENGVTEEMADQKFVSLGVEDASDWGIKVVDREMSSDRAAPSIILRADYGTFDKNMTDQIYYAVKLAKLITDDNGKKVWSETESQWARGKLDYRSCMHSAVYQKGQTTCPKRTNSVTGKSYYGAYVESTGAKSSEDEAVITWEEEWRQTQTKRAEETYEKMNTLAYNLLHAEDLIEGATQTLTHIDQALEEVGDEDGLIEYRVRVTRNLIEQLKGQYASLNVTANEAELKALQEEKVKLQAESADLQTRNSNLQTQNTDLQAKIVQLKAEFDSLGAEKTDLSAQIETLVDEKRALSQQNGDLTTENQDLNGKLQSVQAEIARLEAELAANQVDQTTEDNKVENADKETAKVENGAVQDETKTDNAAVSQATGADTSEVVAQLAVTETGPEKAANAAEVAGATVTEVEAGGAVEKGGPISGQSVSETASSEVEVPNLGEIETKSWLWWLVIPAIFGLGTLGYMVKRLVARRR